MTGRLFLRRGWVFNLPPNSPVVQTQGTRLRMHLYRAAGKGALQTHDACGDAAQQTGAATRLGALPAVTFTINLATSVSGRRLQSAANSPALRCPFALHPPLPAPSIGIIALAHLTCANRESSGTGVAQVMI